MLNHIFKLIVILTINFSISITLYAKTIEQNKLEFQINSQGLINGEIYFFFTIITPSELNSLKNGLLDLDSVGILKNSGIKIELGKSMYVLNRPVGFFDDKQLTQLEYLSYILNRQKLKDKGEGLFEVTHVGNETYTYEMKSYFDADDISTLPNSKVSRAVLAARELDTISKSASTIMVTEKKNFSNFWLGGITVSSYIPLKENKTLVISYQLKARKKDSDSKSDLKDSYKNEIESTRNLENSFQVND